MSDRWQQQQTKQERKKEIGVSLVVVSDSNDRELGINEGFIALQEQLRGVFFVSAIVVEVGAGEYEFLARRDINHPGPDDHTEERNDPAHGIWAIRGVAQPVDIIFQDLEALFICLFRRGLLSRRAGWREKRKRCTLGS